MRLVVESLRVVSGRGNSRAQTHRRYWWDVVQLILHLVRCGCEHFADSVIM
jgi:hypothetical protein